MEQGPGNAAMGKPERACGHALLPAYARTRLRQRMSGRHAALALLAVRRCTLHSNHHGGRTVDVS